MAFLTLLNGVATDHKVDEGGRATAAHTAGTLAVGDSGKMYRYVRNTATQQINRYECCGYVNHLTYTVTTDTSTWQRELPAGVYNQANTVAASEYFWIQVSGQTTVDTEGSGSVGGAELLVLSATDGEATEITTASAAGVVSQLPWVFGISISAEVSGTPDKTTCFLRGLL